MRGFMRRRGPSWELRVYLGRDAVTGAKRYVTRSVRGPRAGAERVLRDMVTAAEAGAMHRAGATFGELCEAWLVRARVQLAANSVVETRRHLDRHLLPALGDVALAGLRPEQFDGLYRDLLGPGPGGKPLSGATVHRIHGVAHRALNVGVRWGWLAANPATGAMPPRPIRRPITPPTPREVTVLIAAARATDPDLAVFLAVAATTGARRGELCALRWHDLDPATGVLDIVRAVTIVAGRATVGPTKTRRGRRIHVDPTTLATLDAHHRHVQTRAHDQGLAATADGYLFSASPTGAVPWRPDRVTRSFRRLTGRVDLDHVRLHHLRHFVATRLLGAGVDLRTVAGRLGHHHASNHTEHLRRLPARYRPARRPRHGPAAHRPDPRHPRQRLSATPAANPLTPTPADAQPTALAVGASPVDPRSRRHNAVTVPASSVACGRGEAPVRLPRRASGLVSSPSCRCQPACTRPAASLQAAPRAT